ncbi:capsid protein [Weissella confusa]|uniref:capsid protein n=1 Tax=Weissella confusa TaxID=1583 RepID=UPI00223C50FE|nr:capsid protein [Weissella confusa]MCS9992363.1 capsid protein [Weissella confusa]
MAVVLDQRDLAVLDQQVAPEASQVWDLLGAGATDVTDADFVGVKEVRVNKMTGFTSADYTRNGDNARTQLSVAKETVQLTHEDWFAYDFDQLDEGENGALTIANATTQQRRLVTFPNKDKVAVKAMTDNATTDGTVSQVITPANALSAYDDAEQYMTDLGAQGPFILFASSDYYKALKQDTSTSHSFTVNETANINGIDRRVGMLDGAVPVKQVAKDRLQVVAGKHINFILVPVNAVKPITKLGTIDLIGAAQDRNGYRDTLKGLDYYDAIILDNAKKVIYVSETTVTEKVQEG